MTAYASFRIAKNSVFLFIARACEFLSGIIIVMLAARYLGVKEFGEYAFIRAVGIVFTPVIAFGSLQILMIEISANKKSAADFVSSGLILNCLTGMFVALITGLIILAFRFTVKIVIIAFYLSLLSQFFIIITKTVSSVFIAYEKMFYDSVLTVITRLSAILFFVISIHYNFGIIGLFIALTAANAMGFVLAVFILTFKFKRIGWSMNSRCLIHLVKNSFPIAISGFLTQGYTYVNVFLLKAFQDIVHLSLFQASQRIIVPLLLLPRSFMIAFVPSLSRMANNADSYLRFKYVCRRMMTYILIIALPICIWGTIYASLLIKLLFGDEFMGAVISFQILIWSIVPLFLNILIDFILTSIKKQKVLIISTGCCFLSNCISGIILIKLYGFVGASIASLFSCFVLVGINFYFVSQYVGFIPVHRIVVEPLLASGIMGMFLYAFSHKFGIIPLIIIGSVLYGSTLFFLKIFNKEVTNKLI